MIKNEFCKNEGVFYQNFPAWRACLQVPGAASLAMLHNCIQIINGWDDFNLHQFHIYGKDYGINYVGGLYYPDNAHHVHFDDFRFDVGDKFTYEYNFFEHIMHDIRIEKIRDFESIENQIICMSGSGMPGVKKHDVVSIELGILNKIVAKKGKLSHKDICDFREKIKRVKFIKKLVNKQLSSRSSE